ncbi:MAG: PKD domain-containing protein [Candidatus Thermoplasmatota archaeon]|nr:PKD domain-containing protein [Candidatus Thermoplasmatota archaeon]
MKKAMVLLAFLVVCLIISLQIDLSVTSSAQGQRSASETWSGEKYLNETYTVNSGETLTIEPGTTVCLAENVKIIVYGTIKAEGTKDNMITFTRWNTTGYWGSIRIFGGAVGCTIKYCKFEYGCWPDDEYYGYIFCSEPVQILNNTFICGDPTDCAINYRATTGKISYNQISGFSGSTLSAGLYIVGSYTAGVAPEVSYNIIKECNVGIWCRAGGNPKISYNTITKNYIGVQTDDFGGMAPDSHPIINNNNIYGNSGYGVSNKNSDVGKPWCDKVDATYNYWGAPNGPSGEGSGSGDAVSKGVDYSNYLTTKIGVLPPTADFSYTFTTDLGNQTIQFTDNSWDDVSIVSWSWDFGDGNTSSEQSPKHTYLIGNKTYTVTLTVKDSDNNPDTTSEQIFVALGGADLDSDNIPNELDDDRDGDGYLNWKDAYPDDPLRYKKEAVGLEEKPSFAPIIAGVVIAVLIVAAIAAGVTIRKKPAKVARPTTVIDDVFLLYRDGRLIKHLTRRLKPIDEEILASMLTAVQDFVKDVFRGEPGELEEMKFGELKFIIGRGEFVTIATIISGPELELVKPQIAKAIKEIEKEHWGVLERWDGDLDKVTPLTEHLEALIEGKYR